MAQNLIDKNKKLFRYRATTNGAVLTKGKRELYLTFLSVNQSKRAKEVIAKNSFDKLYKRGKKVRIMGPNVSHIDFRK
jgi:hypothetical protein